MKKLTIIGITLGLLLCLALWQQQHIVGAKAAPMLATQTVTTTADSGPGSLRQAIAGSPHSGISKPSFDLFGGFLTTVQPFSQAAAPIIIDDFNTGQFFITDNVPINDLPASGAIGGSRDANVNEPNQHNNLFGYMSLDPGNNYVNMQIGANPPIAFNIAWGNNSLFGGNDLNLNASGYDRLVVNLSLAPTSGIMTVNFNNSGIPSASLPLNGAGDYTFLFSSPGLTSLNTADIDGITLNFSGGSFGVIRAESVVITTAPTPTCIVDPVVTTNADGGAGSLRQAIADACPNATITFDTAGVFATPQTIPLTTGELVIDKSLTIDGPGASQLTVSGNDASRVFYISRMSLNTIVTLDGLTVTGGNGIGADGGFVDQSGAGGGIFNDKTGSTSGMLTITNCTVSGNSATHGGGIYSNNNTLTLTNSTVSGNSANSGPGGGIANGGTLILNNSTVSGNDGGGGGGIFNQGGAMTITNSTVSGNTTPRQRRRHFQPRYGEAHQQHRLRQLGKPGRRHLAHHPRRPADRYQQHHHRQSRRL